MHTFNSFDGTPIAFHDAGTGPAVVLLHGFGTDGLLQFGPFAGAERVFEVVAAGFREVVGVSPPMPDPPESGRPGLVACLQRSGARVLVPDMRGFGASGKPPDVAAYENAAMARDVVALCRHLDLPAIDVVGFSMGAVTAARLLTLDTGLVRSVVLSGVGDYILEGEVMNLPDDFPLPPDLPRPLTITAHANALASVLEAGEIVAGNLMSMSLVAVRATGADPKALAAAVRGAVAPPVPIAPLQSVTAPVLVLNGSRDVANGAVRRLLEVIPTARAATCDGDHHDSTWTESYQQAVATFVQSQWPG